MTTKIHALVDALGNPLRFLLTPGQVHDLVGADALLPQMAADVLIADKAFDADDRVIRPLANRRSAPAGHATEFRRGIGREPLRRIGDYLGRLHRHLRLFREAGA